jgi:hypothetical protein
MNASKGARPWLAYTRYDSARMLLARGTAGDCERVEEFLASTELAQGARHGGGHGEGLRPEWQ